jgi:hypothetical protein
MEDRLPFPTGKFYEMASVVDFNNNQRKIIVSAVPKKNFFDMSKFFFGAQGRTRISSSVEINPQDYSPNYLL